MAPAAEIPAIREVLRGWILFGGYGSRTRRGLGSLTVPEERDGRLPKAACRQALADLFGRDPFAPAPCTLGETPLLAGASRLAAAPVPNAEQAWTTALGWLRDFRQGTNSGARQSGLGKPEPARPSISNWPEADKIRHLP